MRCGGLRYILAGWVLILMALLSVLRPGVAEAHAFAPVVLDLRVDGDRVDVQLKLSRSLRTDSGGPETVENPRFPDSCQLLGEPTESGDSLAVIRRWTLVCPSGTVAALWVDLPDPGMKERFLVRFAGDPGAESVAVVQAPGSRWNRSDQPGATTRSSSVLLDYLELGVEHILLGFDHLLFVLCLLLLVRNWRILLGTITSFTIAHSITLALAVLGVVSVPGPPVEATIALSIVLLAAEAARALLADEPQQTLATTRPWVVALGFGLLHGLGFAGALREVGVPSGQVPTALLSFNLGVELGQLCFVAGVLSVALVFRRMERWKPFEGTTAKLELALTYLAGSVAAFWVIERTVGFWG